MGVKGALRDLVIDLDERWDKARLELLRSMGRAGNLTIITYRGIGRPGKLLLRGRVLVYRDPPRFKSDDDFWDNLVNMYRRMHTTEIPGARVRASAAGSVTEVVSDDEGFFEVELDAADQPFSSPRQQVELELLEPASEKPVTAKAEVAVRSPASRFLVISDIDDTVVHTQATNLLAMARTTFLGNASSRTPFAGVSDLYSALVEGKSGDEQNPLVFISRSPWNLYDLFDQFCDLQGIPSGRVFFLRDWGISLEGLSKAKSRGHKFGLIRRILEIEPDLPVILIGDSGQKDPEIYHAISEEFPGRLLGAFIRDVTRGPERAESISALAAEVRNNGAVLYLSKDSLDVARRAADHGWISPAAVLEVAAAMNVKHTLPEQLEALIARPPRDA